MVSGIRRTTKIATLIRKYDLICKDVCLLRRLNDLASSASYEASCSTHDVYEAFTRQLTFQEHKKKMVILVVERRKSLKEMCNVFQMRNESKEA